jgi:UDP-glucose 4-epimerase
VGIASPPERFGFAYHGKKGEQKVNIKKGRHFVSGGGGFIGSHLTDRLVDMGCVVTVYDNFSSGEVQNIRHHIGKRNFFFVRADLLDFGKLKAVMYGHDVVWHLGANTDIPGGNENTDIDFSNCTVATRNVLEAMRQLGIGEIVFTSSSTVYGDIEDRLMGETVGPLLPISLYGAGKLAGEGLVSSYCHLFGMRAWIFRFANVVGLRMGHGVISDFIQKLRENPRELEILGDGNQEKPFFLVEDCLDGMFCAIEKSKERCGVYNLGCETSIGITEVADVVVHEMGLGGVKYRCKGGRRGWPGDVPVVHFDVGKMKGLGWAVKHTSDEAVRIATRRLLG